MDMASAYRLCLGQDGHGFEVFKDASKLSKEAKGM